MVSLPKKSLKLVLCQMQSGEDVDKNLAAVVQFIEKHKEDQPKLLCFPENSLFFRLSSRSQIKGFSLKEDFWGDLKNLCKKNNTQLLLGSVPLKSQGEKRVFNSMVWVGTDFAKEVYQKTYLFDVEVEGEKPQRESDQFIHGSGPKEITVDDWHWGLSVCYDVRFSEHYQSYYKNGVHIIFVPSAFLKATGRAHWHVLLRARAIENQAFVVAPAQAGEHKKDGEVLRKTYGHSLVVDPWGRVLSDLGDEGEASSVVELDPQTLHWVRSQIPMRG